MTSETVRRSEVRPTRAMRRQYQKVLAAVTVTPIVLAAVVTVSSSDPNRIRTAWILCVVLAALLIVGVLIDHAQSKFTLHGDVLQNRARRVDLTRVVEAAVITKNPKWLVPHNPWSTLVLADAAGGRLRMTFTTKRIPHLYEPGDMRTIATSLSRSDSPVAKDMAQRLHAFATA